MASSEVVTVVMPSGEEHSFQAVKPDQGCEGIEVYRKEYEFPEHSQDVSVGTDKGEQIV